MARRKSRKKVSSGRGFGISTASQKLPPMFTHRDFFASRLLRDNRYFHPLPPHRVERVIFSLSNADQTRNRVYDRMDRKLWSKSFFANPLKADPCVRRRERRQVMFAKNLAGRRFGAGGRVRRTPASNISCR